MSQRADEWSLGRLRSVGSADAWVGFLWGGQRCSQRSECAQCHGFVPFPWLTSALLSPPCKESQAGASRREARQVLGEGTGPGNAAGGLSTARQTLVLFSGFTHSVSPLSLLLDAPVPRVIAAEESAVTGSSVRHWGTGPRSPPLMRRQPSEAKSPTPQPPPQASEGSQLGPFAL